MPLIHSLFTEGGGEKTPAVRNIISLTEETAFLFKKKGGGGQKNLAGEISSSTAY